MVFMMRKIANAASSSSSSSSPSSSSSQQSRKPETPPATTTARQAQPPRKKLSFREPEVVVSRGGKPRRPGIAAAAVSDRGADESELLDEELQSQAMRVVRTVGQAFEVCHRVNPSEDGDDRDYDEDEEACSRDSDEDDVDDDDDDVDRGRRDDSDDEADDGLTAKRDTYENRRRLETPVGNDSVSSLDAARRDGGFSDIQRPLRLDIIPPPPVSSVNHRRSSPMNGSEVYGSPMTETSKSDGGVPMSSLSIQHEMQLLRQQLDQQTHQTQAAVAQVHMLRDQLTAESTARMEAQTRTHQLLVHNKELLDHIASLVSLLHDQERIRTELQHHSLPPLPMMCDMPTPSSAPASYLPDLPPPSPRLRSSAYHMQQPMNFDFNFSQPAQTADQQFQAQLLQRLQSLTGTIANTPTCQYQHQQHQQSQQQRLPSPYQPHLFAPSPHQHQPSVSPTINRVSQASSYCASPVANRSTSGDSGGCNDGIIKPLSDDHQQQQQQQVTVVVDRTAEEFPAEPAAAPVLSAPPPGKQKSLLKVSAGAGTSSRPGGKKTATVVGNGPITRSTSEKVPNKSNLMSHVQRTTWARHTTK